MLRIGLVDLDTSHARSFVRRIPRLCPEAKVTAVCDSGQVRSSDEVEQFCREHGCAQYESVEALAGDVDAAMVLSADWEVHLSRSRPLLEAGVPTYVDKPLAGSVRDLQSFVELAQQTGTPLLADSGYRFAAPVERARRDWNHAAIRSLFVMTPFDYFFYGVHAASLVLGLLGPGIETVRCCYRHNEGTLLWFQHRRGTEGHVLAQAPRLFWGAVFNADSRQHCLQFDVDEIHDGMCRRFLAMAYHRRSPLTPSDLMESSLVMLAGLYSDTCGLPVRLDALPSDFTHSSDDFMRNYVATSSPTTLIGN